LEIKWHNAGINDKLKPKYIAAGVDLLTEIYKTGVLSLMPGISKIQRIIL
jgi:hypothetical protein